MGNSNTTLIYPYGEAFHSKHTQQIYLDRVHTVLPDASNKSVIDHQYCLGCMICIMQTDNPYQVFITLWARGIQDGDTPKQVAQKLIYSLIFSAIYHKKYDYWLFAFGICKSLKFKWPYMQICKMPNNSFYTVIVSFDRNTFKYGNFNISRRDIVQMEKMQTLIELLKNSFDIRILKDRISWKPIREIKRKPFRRGLIDPSTYIRV